MNKAYYVYMLTTAKNTALYTGITNDIERRMYEHQNGSIDGFTKKYKCKKLVYFEIYTDPENAVQREKEIKGRIRRKKNALIESVNPEWIDLMQNNYQYPIDPSSLSSSG